jgi:hypothetical protein
MAGRRDVPYCCASIAVGLAFLPSPGTLRHLPTIEVMTGVSEKTDGDGEGIVQGQRGFQEG